MGNHLYLERDDGTLVMRCQEPCHLIPEMKAPWCIKCGLPLDESGTLYNDLTPEIIDAARKNLLNGMRRTLDNLDAVLTRREPK